MALTITEKFRGDLGGKAFRWYDITHDGSAVSIDASKLDLHYIDSIMYHTAPTTTGLASINIGALYFASISGDHTNIIVAACPSTCISHLMAIGW